MKKNTPKTFSALQKGWTLKALNLQKVPEEIRPRLAEGIAATVPGEATLDLLRAGLIEDPFDGANENDQQWIGDVDWRFECDFEWHDDGNTRHDVVAYGLDTVAAVSLNGRPVGRANDFYQTYRWNVNEFLVAGTNTLTVDFSSPVRVAEERELVNGAYPHVEHHPFNQIRKPSYSFGWDWGIDVANAGIWQQIGIDSWSKARIESVRPLVDVRDDGTGILNAIVTIERDVLPAIGHDPSGPAVPVEDPLAVPVTLTVKACDFEGEITGVIEPKRTTATLTLEVPNVRLWWPQGYGEASLYQLEVAVNDGIQGRWAARIGFRTVSVDTAADSVGRPFQISVNGVPVHARGYNWIPDDAFISSVDRTRYERGVRDLVESHSNMVRVWGGGIYEADDFYDLCDEHGIMVWQDFALACAAYDETAGTRKEIETEARQQITRLSTHPSLVVWNGSNENYVAYSEWGGFKEGLRDDDRPKNDFGYGEKPWGDYYYSELFPKLLRELVPNATLYLASSPMSFSKQVGANLDTDGTMHIWDVWNREDYRKYCDYTPRFADEFGYQAPPAWSTLTAVIHDDPLDAFGEQMLVHQKAAGGNYKLARGMRSHLTPGHLDEVSLDEAGNRSWLIPTDEWETLEDWHWACQLQQAHAIEFGVAHMRSLEPVNAGALIWQLNDDWPVVSWSAVDYCGRRKPLWYASQHFFAPRFATIQPRISQRQWEERSWEGKKPAADALALVLQNDTRTDSRSSWTVRRMTMGGHVLAQAKFEVSLEPGGHAELLLPADVVKPNDATAEILVATPDEQGSQRVCDACFERCIYNFAEVLDQKLDPRALEAEITASGDSAVITLTATSYVRDVFCMADKVSAQAVVDKGMVSLLPGEHQSLVIAQPGSGELAEYLSARVLRSANELKVRGKY
ncbi:MAG: glycoside hydrolase family 2 protein [Bifidobacteriaceae bacterium]|nr:glycoside hydrolase family 2 protein [Bifidobacteriaceae bacterium]